MASKKKQPGKDIALINFNEGCAIISQHPMFMELIYRADIIRREGNKCPPSAWAVVTSNGAKEETFTFGTLLVIM
jgi:hypothetical protein